MRLLVWILWKRGYRASHWTDPASNTTIWFKHTSWFSRRRVFSEDCTRVWHLLCLAQVRIGCSWRMQYVDSSCRKWHSSRYCPVLWHLRIHQTQFDSQQYTRNRFTLGSRLIGRFSCFHCLCAFRSAQDENAAARKIQQSPFCQRIQLQGNVACGKNCKCEGWKRKREKDTYGSRAL